MAAPNNFIPDTQPATVAVRYGFASNTMAFPAGTPVIPAVNQPWSDDPHDHIVAWIVTDDIPMTDLQQSWAENYGFPVYRDQLEPLTALRAAAGE